MYIFVLMPPQLNVRVKYSPDQSKVKRRAGKFLKSKCEISFSIRYLIFEIYWAGEILKASKVAFKN